MRPFFETANLVTTCPPLFEDLGVPLEETHATGSNRPAARLLFNLGGLCVRPAFT
jgi:hypothetical protein